MKQIYLDNGATSFPKAPGVGQAMKDYIEKVGVNVNRSSYRATAEAALSTLTVREDLCRLFGAGEDPSLCHLYQRRDHEPEYDHEGGAAPR